MRRLGEIWCWLEAWLDKERDRLPLWLPVFMGAGVLGYYMLRTEPAVWVGPVMAVVSLAVCVMAGLAPAIRHRSEQQPADHDAIGRLRLIITPIAAASIGFASAELATWRALPPELDLPNHATIVSGTIRGVEGLPDGRRITVQPVMLDDRKLRRSVRVRLQKKDDTDLATGDTIRIRALVRAPSWPAYPGAWDLQRDDFYAGYAGFGYALGRVDRLERELPAAPARLVQWLRETIARRVRAMIPGAAGAVSVTLLTGASMSIPETDHAAFRDSGLAHLLAVAGLHIGIVMGFALMVARFGFALNEHASLFWPTKKLAALCALMAGGFYMVLTGMHVPIVRSFAMACLFTVAVLADRRPFSLRGLALAACALMLIAPQEVPGVSFQMSFAAVLALIAGYEALRPWLRRLHGKSWPMRFASHLVALALTSALAGTASAPYGAYHFGHVQVYFILANMIAVPLTAMWVMPAGLIALLLMPLHLEGLALVPMGWGARAVLAVARWTAALPAATFAVPHIPAWGLGVFSLGLAWLGIWRGPRRLAGVVAIVVGLASPVVVRPPDVLVSSDARLIAIRTAEGVYLQQAQGGSKFERDAWAQYWAVGGFLPLPVTGGGDAIRCGSGSCLVLPYAERRGVLLARGIRSSTDCGQTAVIVSSEPARGLCPRPWPALVDRFTVWRNGSAAIWLGPDGARIVADRDERGARPWVPPPPKPRQQTTTLPMAKVDRDADAEATGASLDLPQARSDEP